MRDNCFYGLLLTALNATIDADTVQRQDQTGQRNHIGVNGAIAA